MPTPARRGRRFDRLPTSFLALLLLLLPCPASALTIVKMGVGGGRGQDGESVVAIAESGDPSNSATAIGGGGGDALFVSRAVGGDGGDASATARTDTQAVATAAAEARGGDGGQRSGAGGFGGSGGDAAASASARNQSNAAVTVTALARGGAAGSADRSGGPPASGGDASLGVVRGESLGGGDVSVRGEAVGGDGGSYPGGNAHVVDALDGATTGALVLRQIARGGFGGGGATSELTREATSRTLTLTTEAFGGEGSFAGSGGDARAFASGSNGGGIASVTARATGGTGGPGAGSGGGADAEAFARTSGNGRAAVASAIAEGGPNDPYSPPLEGGVGGSAKAVAVGEALGISPVDVLASARGGLMEFFLAEAARDGVDGGSATARAEGRAAGNGAVTARAVAVAPAGEPGAGTGNRGGDGGSAEASGVGVSDSGAVTVRTEQWGGVGGYGGSEDFESADGGNGADVQAVGAVSGSTAGHLLLDQVLRGGRGGSGATAGRGGNAHAALTADNPGGGSLEIKLDLEGGEGGTQALEGQAGKGGDATLGEVVGNSEHGAAVRVAVEARGGRGGSGSFGSARGGDGGDVELIDAVGGSTAGALSLSQIARGGQGGPGTGPGGAEQGAAGKATSIIDQESASSSLTVHAGAFSGESSSVETPALAEVRARNSAGSVSATVQAAARNGGTGTANVRAISEGDGHDVRIGLVAPNVPHAGGGAGVSGGGEALSTSLGVANGASAVSVRDFARGGAGASGANGGYASSYAEGRNSGWQSVDVVAEAEGGAGGFAQSPNPGGDGAMASAVGRGESTGGGNVTVTAIQRGGDGAEGRVGGDGAASDMTDSVSGSTRGALTLVQIAQAGDAGNQSVFSSGVIGGDGGAASSRLAGTNPGGGDLGVWVEAQGGNGGRANAGTGSAGSGGAVEIDAYGISSNGRAVAVTGIARGGSGGSGYPSVHSGTGFGVTLIDAVRGETTGDLSLRQVAIGGDGGSGGVGAVSAGDAVSRLIRQTASSSLRLDVEATGGRGLTARTGSVRGGNADASAWAVNEAGSASIDATALAGGGGEGLTNTGGEKGSGGNATLEVTAITYGDGNPIAIGLGGDLIGAFAGGASPYGLGAAAAGTASSRSTARAFGASDVVVVDRAVGGDGGDGGGGGATSHATGISEGNGLVSIAANAEAGQSKYLGDGADAVASAFGAGGVGTVEVSSSAAGGSSAYPYNSDGMDTGGDALASADAIGLGEVLSSAHASTGMGSLASGDAIAIATAIGSSGRVQAEASASSPLDHLMLATSSGEVEGASKVLARARIGSEETAVDPIGFNMAVIGTALPQNAVVTQMLEGDPTVQAGLGETAEYLALVEMMSSSPSSGESILFGGALSMSIDVTEILASDRLMLGLLDPESSGTGFESLRFRIERDEVILLDQSFADAREAIAFFDDSLLDLGALPDDELAFQNSFTQLDFSFEVRAADPTSRFSMNFVLAGAQAVPEPNTAFLLGFGLLGLALRGAVARPRRTTVLN